MDDIDAKILEPVADKLKIKKSALPKLLIFWGVFGIVLNIFWLINSLYPLPRLLALDTEPSFWWQYVLYIFFIILSAIELAYGVKLYRQEKPLRKNQRFNALLLLLIPLFLSILLSPLSVISTLHFFTPKTPSNQIACTLEAKICPDGSSVGRTGPNCSFAPCPTIPKDQTKNWKTYRLHNLQLKLPTKWKVSQRTDSEGDYLLADPKYICGPCDLPTVFALSATPNTTITKEINKLINGWLLINIQETPTKMGEVIGVTFSGTIHDTDLNDPRLHFENGSEKKYILFENNGLTYISDISDKNWKNTFNQIFSTFKFIQ